MWRDGKALGPGESKTVLDWILPIFFAYFFFHRAGSITGLLLLIALAFGIFICCLRRKLPDGVPKPPVCTTVKVNHWKYT